MSQSQADGNYYSEVYQKDYKRRKREPFVKSYFDRYTLNIDLSELDNVDLDEKEINDNYQMMDVKLLDSSVTELSIRYMNDRDKFSQKYAERIDLSPIEERYRRTEILEEPDPDFLSNYKLVDKVRILEIAKSNISNTLADLNNRKVKVKVDVKRLSKFEIAIHEKYVLGFSCILLFFVGAPLGAIIRKGGLGLPIVVGVVIFLAFHFIGIFAKNSAEDNTVSPFVASWLSTFILLPLGIYLTHRATTDQGIFDADTFFTPLKRLFAKRRKVSAVPDIKDRSYTITDTEKEMLDKLSSNQLKDIVLNYKKYEYSEDVRLGAIDRLGRLGISLRNLKVQGYYLDED